MDRGLYWSLVRGQEELCAETEDGLTLMAILARVLWCEVLV